MSVPWCSWTPLRTGPFSKRAANLRPQRASGARRRPPRRADGAADRSAAPLQPRPEVVPGE